MGFPDVNVVMDFDSKNPEQAFPVLLSGYEEAPAALMFLKSSGITEPKQLNGKRIGSAANDSTFKLLPLFAQQTGMDLATIQIQNIEPSLREVLLAQGKVDAVPGQVFNSVLELQAKGVKASDIGTFLYKDYGLELYANSVAASPAFLKANPEAVKGFLRATIKGLKDVAADPELGVKAALAFEPLLNADTERERLRAAMSCCCRPGSNRRSRSTSACTITSAPTGAAIPSACSRTRSASTPGWARCATCTMPSPRHAPTRRAGRRARRWNGWPRPAASSTARY